MNSASFPESSPGSSHINHRHFVCLRSTLAGFILAVMVFAGLIALALAFGGIGLSDGATMRNASIFAGASVIASCMIAIFAGSYFSVRLTGQQVDVIGSAQGLMVGSLMVGFVLTLMVGAMGFIGKSVAGATGAAMVSANMNVDAGRNQAVRDMIEESLGGAMLKTDAATVVRGISLRLMRGDDESAANYLAMQSNLAPSEAQTRIAVLKQRADELMTKAREASATALKAGGWSVFLLITLSAIASVLGGLLGSQFNLRRTMDIEVPSTVRRRDQKILESQPAH